MFVLCVRFSSSLIEEAVTVSSSLIEEAVTVSPSLIEDGGLILSRIDCYTFKVYIFGLAPEL